MAESTVARAFRVLQSYGLQGLVRGIPRELQNRRRRRQADVDRQRTEQLYRDKLQQHAIDDEGMIELQVHGRPMKLIAADPGLTRDLLLNDGVRERGATNIVKALLRGDMTILELGANQGYYLLLEAACTSPNSRIYAFEPHPANIRVLRRNIAVNGIEDRVLLTQAAVSDQAGEVHMVDSDFSNFHRVSTAADRGDGDLPLLAVPCTTLDAFCATHNIEHVDFIRMDVEGHEVQIIDGAVDTLRRSPNCIVFFELHTQLIRNAGRDPLSLLHVLQGLEYGCFAMTGHGPKQTHVAAMEWPKLLQDLPFLLSDFGAHLFFSKTPEVHASMVQERTPAQVCA